MATMIGGNGGGSGGGTYSEIIKPTIHAVGGYANVSPGVYNISLLNHYLDKDAKYQKYLFAQYEMDTSTSPKYESAQCMITDLDKMTVDFWGFNATYTQNPAYSWDFFVQTACPIYYHHNTDVFFTWNVSSGHKPVSGNPLSFCILHYGQPSLEAKDVSLSGLTSYSYYRVDGATAHMTPYISETDTLYLGTMFCPNSSGNGVPAILKIQGIATSSTPTVDVIYLGTQSDMWTRVGHQVFKHGNTLTFVNLNNGRSNGFIVDIDLTTDSATEKSITYPSGTSVVYISNLTENFFRASTTSSSNVKPLTVNVCIYKGNIYIPLLSVDSSAKGYRMMKALCGDDGVVYEWNSIREQVNGTVLRDPVQVDLMSEATSSNYTLGFYSMDRAITFGNTNPTGLQSIMSTIRAYGVEGRHISIGKINDVTTFL